MKKLWILMLAAVMALTPVFALAQDSRGNIDIPETRVTNVEAEDETQEVIPPEVQIVPDTEEIMDLQEEVQAVYRLTVYYVYVDGTQAAETYETFLFIGDEYSVESPEIAGFTTMNPRISGTMPQRNLVFTVVYMSPEEENEVFKLSEMTNLFNLDDYETPLGLGFTFNNVGICFE